MNDHRDPQDATLAVWAGEDRPHWENATPIAVVHSVSFGDADLEHWAKVSRGEIDGYVYSRNTNPTVSDKRLKKMLKFFKNMADIYATRVSGDTLSHLLLLTFGIWGGAFWHRPSFFLHEN